MKRLYFLFLSFTLFSTTLAAQELISVTYKGSRTKAQMVADFGIFMQYGVNMYKFQYATLDVKGQPDTASGLFVLPDVPSANVPLLVFMHGTVNSKTDVPSQLAGGYELAMVYAALGYATAAPDLLGLGDSRGFHPYLHAASQSSAAIDMLYAAREYLDSSPDFEHNGKLFLTGYSQGGHASMGLHRELETNYQEEWPVTAAAHMSGPYSLSGVMRDFATSDATYNYIGYIPNIFLGLNEAYQLYDDFSLVFKQPYLTPIEAYYAGSITLSNLNNTLIAMLVNEVGAPIPRYLFQDSILLNVAEDPNHPINVALAANDVYDWAPQAPTRLYYCTADDQVLYTNSLVADSVMNANGAPNVQAIDANPLADHGQCVEPAVTRAIFFFGPLQGFMVSTLELATAAPYRVFPNPARGQYWVEGLQAGDEIQFRNLEGRLLERRRSAGHKEELSVQDYQPGIYFLQILGQQGAAVLKIVLE
jgi:pimeloyl-ACP methyl ester carboxylesterase